MDADTTTDMALQRLDTLIQEAGLLVDVVSKRRGIDLSPTLPLELWQEMGAAPLGRTLELDPKAGHLERRLKDDGRVWKSHATLDFAEAAVDDTVGPIRRVKQSKKTTYFLRDEYNGSKYAYAPTTALDTSRISWERQNGDPDSGRVQLAFNGEVRGMNTMVEKLRGAIGALKRRRDEVKAFEAEIAALPAAKKARNM